MANRWKLTVKHRQRDLSIKWRRSYFDDYHSPEPIGATRRAVNQRLSYYYGGIGFAQAGVILDRKYSHLLR